MDENFVIQHLVCVIHSLYCFRRNSASRSRYIELNEEIQALEAELVEIAELNALRNLTP